MTESTQKSLPLMSRVPLASGQSLDRLQLQAALKNLRRAPLAEVARLDKKIAELPTYRLFE